MEFTVIKKIKKLVIKLKPNNEFALIIDNSSLYNYFCLLIAASAAFITGLTETGEPTAPIIHISGVKRPCL